MKKLIKRYWIVLVSVLAIIITLLLYILWKWNREYKMNESIDYDAFGAFGSFYGGVLGTFFVVIGVVIAFNTYQSQIKAQEKEQIESRFFELLKLHQENVIVLKNIDPDIFNVYIKLIRSFQAAISKYNVINKKDWNSKDILKLSYLYFFYGSIELSQDRLEGIGIEFDETGVINKYFEKQGYEYTPTYKDYGIYFRQLFQTVKYIDGKNILTYQEKYDYIKILRARLNIEEQYLLFLNSLVASGVKWEDGNSLKNDKLITKYNLIKNIPKGFNQIDGLSFSDKYKDIYYEYQGEEERKKRKEFEEDYS